MTDIKSRLSGGIDWIEIKSRFIGGTMQLIDLANEYKVKEGTIRSRAKREDWQRERNELQLIATKTANDATIASKADLLAQLNEIDLSSAQALRDKANEMMLNISSASELKSLSGVFDSAQKISRLALGASTENNSVTQRMLEPLKDTDFLG